MDYTQAFVDLRYAVLTNGSTYIVADFLVKQSLSFAII